MRHQRGEWREKALEAAERIQLDAYAEVKYLLSDWGQFMREKDRHLRSPDFKNPHSGFYEVIPEIPDHLQVVSDAVMKLPSIRDGFEKPQARDAVEARYLWQVYRKLGPYDRMIRLERVTDQDVGAVLKVSRSAGYSLLREAYAGIRMALA